MPNEESESITDDELSQLSCLDIGDCGTRDLDDGFKAVDLKNDLTPDDVKLERDPTPNKAGGHDLIIHNARILSPGQRNQFWYPIEAVKGTKHLKKRDNRVLNLEEASSPFVVPHSSDPVDTIGRIENLHWDELEKSIVGDPRVYDDPRIPKAQTTIAILERDNGFMSLSTRLKVKPIFQNKNEKPSVDDLRLIHVAWVDVGADPTAGKDLSNSEDDSQASDNTSPETVDLDLLPLADRNRSWDGGGAEKRVWALANGDGSKAAKAYFWKDPQGDPNLRKSYKLPFADVINGTLTAVPAGIIAALQRIDQAQIGNSTSAVLAKIKSYYAKMGMDWPKNTNNASADAPQNENRGRDMETDEAQKPDGDEQTDMSQTETPQGEEAQVTTPKSFSDLKDDEVVSMTAGELRKSIADLKKELYQQYVDETERENLKGEILKVDSSDEMKELVESLAENKQIRLLKDIIAKLFNQISERDNSIATLEAKQYRATGEKPSLSIGDSGVEDLNAIAEKYYGPQASPNSVRDKMRGVVSGGNGK